MPHSTIMFLLETLWSNTNNYNLLGMKLCMHAMMLPILKALAFLPMDLSLPPLPTFSAWHEPPLSFLAWPGHSRQRDAKSQPPSGQQALFEFTILDTFWYSPFAWLGCSTTSLVLSWAIPLFVMTLFIIWRQHGAWTLCEAHQAVYHWCLQEVSAQGWHPGPFHQGMYLFSCFNLLTIVHQLSTNKMLIVVFANLLSIKHARVHDELSTFIHSKQFKVSWLLLNSELPVN